MNVQLKALYVDLLKNSVCFALWDDAGAPVNRAMSIIPRPFRPFIRLLSAVLRPLKLQLLYAETDSRAEIEEGRTWPLYAHTMIGLRRMDNLQSCIESALEHSVPGDLIEAGVWRGGAAIFMRGMLAAHGSQNRRVFVADSFCGLPQPDAARYPADKGDDHHRHEILAVSRSEVEANFRAYGLLDEQVVFLEGWFADTLPDVAAATDAFAVIRIDGDMYGSTTEALEALYPKLSSGGYVIVDDYALDGCRKATDDFRVNNRITTPLSHIDWTGVFWQKP